MAAAARIAALAALALLLAVGVFASPAALATGPTPSRAALPAVTNITYNSSVDGFPLSYLEYTPSGYAGAPAPLVVFLHGAGTATNNVSGGVGGSGIPLGLITNASALGFLAISLNTRSGQGYYLNTPCGGPQEQDVLDAIAAEKALRSVTSVYLVGFSMGSAGALALAGNDGIAGLAGVATAGTITDFAETFDYNGLGTGHYLAFVTDECGHAPSPTNHTSAGDLARLAAFRFHPQNYSALKLVFASAADDTTAPNNYTVWPYANVNSTTVNGTCRTVAALGEPANCSQAYVNETGHPPFLAIWERTGGHSAGQLPYGSVLRYWMGYRTGGFFTSVNPPTGTFQPVVFSWEGLPTITNSQTGCGATTGFNAAALNISANRTLLVFIGLKQTSATYVKTVTDTANDTFAHLANVTLAGQAHAELWVANRTHGNAANRVTGALSASTAFCFWDLSVRHTLLSAPLGSLAAATGSNTTAGAAVSPTATRALLLTYATAPQAETYSGLYGLRTWAQANQTTTLSESGNVANVTSAGAIFPQVGLSATGSWAAVTIPVRAAATPAAPSGLAGTAINDTAVSLSWTLPTGGGLTNLSVFWGPTCAALGHSANLSATATAMNVSGLTVGSTTCFAVGAFNYSGIGALAFANVTTSGGGGGGGGGGGSVSGQEALFLAVILAAAGAAVLFAVSDRKGDGFPRLAPFTMNPEPRNRSDGRGIRGRNAAPRG